MKIENEGIELEKKLASQYEDRISRALKGLLEEKHLYQSVMIEYTDLLPLEGGLVPYNNVRIIVREYFADVWIIQGRPLRKFALPGGGGDRRRYLTAKVPDVRLYCKTCKRLEAHNAEGVEDILNRSLDPTEHYSSSNGTAQVFALTFECQSCKGIPQAFLIQRAGPKLTLSGRSPMEVVEVPSVIPDAVRRYYSSSVVAYQSGETLGANFFLRTLIEQWVYSTIPTDATNSEVDADLDGGEETKRAFRADKALQSYMAGLPQDFKQRFSSLRKLYEDLSADIHSATGDSGLFEHARTEIVEHFEARRLYRL